MNGIIDSCNDIDLLSGIDKDTDNTFQAVDSERDTRGGSNVQVASCKPVTKFPAYSGGAGLRIFDK